MGESHLRLSPIVGKIPNAEHSSGILTYPAAIDLNFGKAWIPKSASLMWSEGLQKIIVTREDTVEIYNLDGQFEKSYPGKLLSVSPSGTKLLFKDGTWLDLLNGKTVKFAWDQNHVAPYSNHAVWSENENRVFVCCFVYGDAKTGESFDQWDNGAESEALGYGKWILSDRYLLAGTSLNLFVSPPLFDASTKSIHTVGELAGIPTTLDGNDNMCNVWYIAPNGRYVWIACFDGSHLVDLTTFKSQDYPEYPFIVADVDWSTDSKFIKISCPDDKNSSIYNIKILSIASQELLPVPEDCYLQWPPIDNLLICWSKTTKAAIYTLDTQTMSVQKETVLPIEFQELISSPDGKHIVLLARDSSLWQVDYPTLENLEQLTPAMPELTHPAYGGIIDESLIKNVVWSPDGASLAFIGGTDIYIVDTQVKP
jgi:WD40 repeat protein